MDHLTTFCFKLVKLSIAIRIRADGVLNKFHQDPEKRHWRELCWSKNRLECALWPDFTARIMREKMWYVITDREPAVMSEWIKKREKTAQTSSREWRLYSSYSSWKWNHAWTEWSSKKCYSRNTNRKLKINFKSVFQRLRIPKCDYEVSSGWDFKMWYH